MGLRLGRQEKGRALEDQRKIFGDPFLFILSSEWDGRKGECESRQKKMNAEDHRW